KARAYTVGAARRLTPFRLLARTDYKYFATPGGTLNPASTTARVWIVRPMTTVLLAMLTSSRISPWTMRKPRRRRLLTRRLRMASGVRICDLQVSHRLVFFET